jgi:hypothetical protein
MNKMVLLTKSKYMNGLQCEKLLWIIYNAPEKIPEVTESTQFRFDMGHEVGEYAKKVFENGIDLPQDFKENITRTKESLNQRKPLFEAGFMVDNLFSRIDILNPVGNNEWDIIEVKSSTSLKEEHVHDVSFQRHTALKAGLKIRKCHLMHLNNQYVKQGDINPQELFTIEDISGDVEKVSVSIQERINNMFKIIRQDVIPEIGIGKYCTNPYECAMVNECWSFLPENSVLDLYRGGKKSFELLDNGTHAIKDIPEDYKLNDKQKIQLDCEKSGQIHIHKESIKHFLKTLKYPLYFLDFETLNPPIPVHDGMRPYQRIPFQFSLHVVQEDGKTEHHEFLHDSKDDPRPNFFKTLKEVLGDSGSIVVYNQSFELGVLKELVDAFPEYDDWNDLMNSRVVDLLIPFRNFSYYNPKQKGSASIKKVLPALTGKNYDNLDIGNGDLANISYYNSIYGNLEKKEIEKIRKDLLIYCGQDTEAMIWIVDELKKLIY